jgi:hypothetical protein
VLDVVKKEADMKKEKVLAYGIDRLRDGTATVMKDPVQKGDRIEWNGFGYLTRIFRDGKPLYWLGQKIGWTAEGEELIALFLTVEQEPGFMSIEECKAEGFTNFADYLKAFVAAYGEERLWKPAWRVQVGVNKIFIQTEDGGPETEVINAGQEN